MLHKLPLPVQVFTEDTAAVALHGQALCHIGCNPGAFPQLEKHQPRLWLVLSGSLYRSDISVWCRSDLHCRVLGCSPAAWGTAWRAAKLALALTCLKTGSAAPRCGEGEEAGGELLGRISPLTGTQRLHPLLGCWGLSASTLRSPLVPPVVRDWEPLRLLWKSPHRCAATLST